jgi:antitoxin Phd
MTTLVIFEGEMKEIQLKDAKATLSAVVDQAVRGDPSIITRHGKRQAVVLSFEEYEKLANIPSFGRLLASFPGEEDDLPARSGRPSRAVDL